MLKGRRLQWPLYLHALLAQKCKEVVDVQPHAVAVLAERAVQKAEQERTHPLPPICREFGPEVADTVMEQLAVHFKERV